MKLISLHLLCLPPALAGGNHAHHKHLLHHEDHAHEKHGHPHDDHHGHGGHHGHNDHKKPIHNALLRYYRDKIKFDWKQLSSDEKHCPICPTEDQHYGKLLSVLPRQGETYKNSEWLLPNKICPVNRKAIDLKVFSKFKGKKVFFNCEMNRQFFDKDSKKYANKLELNPAMLGQTILTHKSHLKDK